MDITTQKGTRVNRSSYTPGSLRHRIHAVRHTRSGAFTGNVGGAFSIVALSVLLLLALSAAPAQASKAVLGSICKEAGSLGGQCIKSRGVAINRSGAGAVTADDVYVADNGNNRVQQLTAAGAFVRAFGANVVRTGPDNNTAVNEVQSATIKADSGTFKLRFAFGGSTQTTAPIKYNAVSAEVESALQALSNVGAIGGTIVVTGGPGNATGSNPYTLTFGGALGGTDLQQITVDGTGLGIPQGTVLTCAGGPTGGTGATTVAYQWLSGGTPASGPGATTSTYTTVAADSGKVLQCQVIATHTAGSAKTAAIQVSNPRLLPSVAPVVSPPLAPAAVILSPTGAATTAGNKLNCASTGTWVGVTQPFTYQWYRNGAALSGNGANTSEYTLQASDLSTAANFQCAVTGSNAGGSVTEFSADKVTAAPAPAPSPTAPTATAVITGGPESSSSTTTNGIDVPEICVAASGDVCQGGISGAIAGSVSEPESIAVDQETGNVYVSSKVNKRVDVFSAKGVFEGAFGWSVNKGTPEDKLQFCTTATGCRAGESTPRAGGLFSSFKSSLAVDPGNGHIYVGDPGDLRVNEFSPTLNGSDEVTAVAFIRAFGGDVISGGAKGTGSPFNALGLGPIVHEVATTEKAFLPGQEISGAGLPAGTIITDRGREGTTEKDLFLTLSKSVETAGINVPITAVAGPGNAPRNEKQTVTISSAVASGNFKLKFTGDTIIPNAVPDSTTADIHYNATPGEVEVALTNLANIGVGNVVVTSPNPGGSAGVPGGPYTVEFKGARFSDTNVQRLAAVAGSAPSINGSVTIATSVEGTSPEVCTSATTCKAGAAGEEGGWFAEHPLGVFTGTPNATAVDANGYIYAVSAIGTCSQTSPCRLQKFNPDGSFKEVFGPSSGGAAECQLGWTNGEAANTEAPVGVAVDPNNQHVFVTRKSSATEFELCEFDSNGILKDRSAGASFKANTEGYLSPTVSSTGEVYVNAPLSSTESTIYVIGEVPPPGAEISGATEVGQSTATLNGKVTVPAIGAEAFATSYHFEYSGDNGLSWTKAPVPDASAGSVAGTYNISQKITGLQPNLTYRFRLLATTGPSATSGEETFHTLAAKPAVTHADTSEITGISAKLTGFVNPNNSATTYHFEWGKTTAYGNETPDFDAFIGSGGEALRVSAKLSGLQPSTEYHFRIVATNGAGTTEGPDAGFTTNSCEGLNSAGLPDCRGFEQVSPNDKRPVGTVALLIPEQLNFQAARDGNSMFYTLLGGLEGATAGGEVKYVATRTPEKWQSRQITAPALIPFAANSGVEEASVSLYNSPDLSCGFIESFEPLTADTPKADIEKAVHNLYRWNADGTYTLISAPVPLNEIFEPKMMNVDGASADCSHVLFHTNYRLLTNAPSSGFGLYEWANGSLRLAGVLPDGSLVGSAVAGNGTTGPLESGFNSVSADGSRVFFTATSNAGGDSGNRAVFVRKNGTTTTDVSQSQSVGTDNNAGSRYEMATPSGSHVYFSARYGLAATSSAGATVCAGPGGGGQGCDLYDYNVTTGTLKDLSADANPADAKESGRRCGLIDASDDGSYVYFAARDSWFRVGQH